ncbi:hypothetical protein ACFV4N_17715 [Actinosynnema sp. NPDC059797]
MRLWRRTALSITAIGLALAGSASVAVAGPVADDAQRVEREVRELLRLHPGSHRIGTTEVELRPGLVASVPPARTGSGEIGAADTQGCRTSYVCLNEHADFRGYGIALIECGVADLYESFMPDGRRWSDQVSSIRNAQTGGLQARFHNYSGSGTRLDPANWRLVLVLNAGHYLKNLTKDSSADGGNANDKIDIVHVC